jgi:hypothetical protein
VKRLLVERLAEAGLPHLNASAEAS